MAFTRTESEPTPANFVFSRDYMPDSDSEIDGSDDDLISTSDSESKT